MTFFLLRLASRRLLYFSDVYHQYGRQLASGKWRHCPGLRNTSAQNIYLDISTKYSLGNRKATRREGSTVENEASCVPWTVDHLWRLYHNQLIRFWNIIVLSSLVTDRRTDGHTDRSTTQCICLAWWRHQTFTINKIIANTIPLNTSVLSQ